MGKNYTAYVGSYTFHGSSKGISILEVDVENGRFTKRREESVNNSSYLTVSHDNRFLYSVVDEGIAAFKILPDGDLEHINTTSIKGMRGCFATTDKANRYLITAGHHDGKMTVSKIKPDGSVGRITAEIFDRGIGSVAERNFRPHISCVQFTPDEKFLCMVDLGIDQVKIYKFDHNEGSIRLVDIIHCEMNSAPRHLRFSKDGRHMYLISELKNYISVYNYLPHDEQPEFQFKQLVSTLGNKKDERSAACALKFSSDDRYVFCSNAGDNSVGIFERHPESGLLYQKCVLPISGDYPKDIEIFPDDKHLVAVNQDSNSLTFFSIDYKNGLIIMNGRSMRLDSGNSCVIVPNQKK
ncbi:MAG: lactonase family protein [Lachnospiraceae bacterium]